MKNDLINTYQLTLDNGWYWQKKENMSPWKVFSINHFDNKSLLWLLFRVHKLCGAKYSFFKDNNDWSPITFDPIVGITITDIVHAEGFMNNITGRFITITKLQQIRDKDVFINIINIISSK